ncbi:hypothetical protein AVEN_177812-1 [Araneus ventricosus]|uniref:Uncharacterized protein n=1 Tax=Araneus ventricosus TaxID=182803 RepID=A0A4Y2WP14_ARAVE|nr:hypothetical protein AVEN_177812-1 [Araneus ventricosus]
MIVPNILTLGLPVCPVEDQHTDIHTSPLLLAEIFKLTLRREQYWTGEFGRNASDKRRQWRFFAQVLEELAWYFDTLGGPQNLFDVHFSAKPTPNLRHRVEGPQNDFAPVASYCQNPPLTSRNKRVPLVRKRNRETERNKRDTRVK